MAAPAMSPQTLLEADERQSPRREVVDSGLVTVEMAPAGFGLMCNVSERGIGVYTLKNLIPSQVVQVSFFVPGSSKRVECNARIAWAMGSHAGLHIRDFEGDSATALKKWLTTMQPSRKTEKPRQQRRPFPLRDEQVRSIQAHIENERLNLEQALQFMVTRFLDLTNANGGAIALGVPPAMICCASAGLAPDVGITLSADSGLTGECIRSGQTIYCEDTELDSRVDREACRELNLRSSLIVPVLRQERVSGVLEVFSPSPAAFEEDHRWLMTRLAEVTAELAYPAAKTQTTESMPSQARVAREQETAEADPVAATSSAVAPKTESPGRSNPKDELKSAPAPASRHVPTSLPAAAPSVVPDKPQTDPGVRKYLWVAGFLCLALLLILLVVRHRPAPLSKTPSVPIAIDAPAESPRPAKETAPIKTSSAPEVLRTKEVESTRTERSKEQSHEPVISGSRVLALPRGEATSYDDEQPQTAPAVTLSTTGDLQDLAFPASTRAPELEHRTTVTGGTLIHRVEPAYPLDALQRHLQGDIVLRLHVNKDGKVTQIRELKGDPLLGSAARAAVRQWRYEPFKRDNIPLEMDATVTLRFRIPG